MHSAANAYARTARTGLTGRALEAAVLDSLAAALTRSAEGGPATQPALDAALLDNRTLWSMLAADATNEHSQVPPAIRANFVELAAFVFKQTHLAMLTPSPDLVAPLARINREIAAGLASAAPAPAATAADTPRAGTDRAA